MDNQPDTQVPQPPPERDGRGHFLPGNKIARGNRSAIRQRELSDAVTHAVGTERLAGVMLKLADLADAGDATAASVLLNHALGRPRERAPIFEPLDLGDLRTPDGLAEAHAQLARAVAAGELPSDVAGRCGELVDRTAQIGVIRDLLVRLERIEASTK